MHAAREGLAARFRLPRPFPQCTIQDREWANSQAAPAFSVRRRDARTNLCLTKHVRRFEELIRDDVNEVFLEARAPPRTRLSAPSALPRPAAERPQPGNHRQTVRRRFSKFLFGFPRKTMTKPSVREPLFNSSIHGLNDTEKIYRDENWGLETRGGGAVSLP